MDIIDYLTNEKISRNFNNQFDLVNYAIKLAANMIQTGREPRVKMNTENPALLILEEIIEGKDTFVEVSAKKEQKNFKEIELERVKEKVEEEADDSELLEDEEETQEVLS